MLVGACCDRLGEGLRKRRIVSQLLFGGVVIQSNLRREPLRRLCEPWVYHPPQVPQTSSSSPPESRGERLGKGQRRVHRRRSGK